MKKPHFLLPLLVLRGLALLAAAGVMVAPALHAKENTAPAAATEGVERAPLSTLDAARVERISWGTTPALIAEVQRIGFERWLQGQLKPAPAVLPAAVQARIDEMDLTRVPMAERVRAAEEAHKSIGKGGSDEEKKAAQKDYRQQLQQDGREAASRSLLLELHSPNQLQEQMTWFWMNHFSIGANKRNIATMIGDYESGIRAKALTRFRDVLEASVFHPAMLRYLDNERNAAGKINENYARELLELHTMGVDGGYSQQDVQELAKVLTGLGIVNDHPKFGGRVRMVENAASWRQGMVVFNPAKNEPGVRTLLGQRVSAKGLDGIREVLDRLAAHPATARYVSYKLAQYFVADAPPDALVDAMKAKYLATGGDIASLLQTLFASKEFEASLGRKFKDPQHYVVSAVRVAYGGSDGILNTQPMLNWLQRLGQTPYGRQTPDGWPMVESAWASPGQMTARFEVARLLADSPRALFRDDDHPAPATVAAAQVNNLVWRTAYTPRLSEATRGVLAEAQRGAAADWNALALSSPEFMRR